MNTSWAMSIRTKIFLGCISLTLITVLVGVLSQAADRKLNARANGLYDNAFMSMSYLRSAQSEILGVSRDIAAGEGSKTDFVERLQSALDSLEVARERAMSEPGRDYAQKLTDAVSSLQSQLTKDVPAPVGPQFKPVERMFDMAVEVYAGDGFHLRRSIAELVRRTQMEMSAAMIVSVVIAIVITMMLSRAIVPSIRRAVGIASAIAGGRLDNRIEKHGSSELGVLLDALASMQDGIAEKIARIETLRADQASSHAVERALQHARFEAALNNMTLGLCMFDADGALLVQNKRFAEMFGSPVDEMEVAAILPGLRAGASASLDADGFPVRATSHQLKDGRIIAISQEAMEGGGRVVTYEDITARTQAEERLSHIARHDMLTGLPNRLLFREQVERGRRRVRHGGVLAIHCLDLDRFKSVNDTLGHPIGDGVLREAAVRLLRTVGEGDTVVRLGGDEFAVVQYAGGGRDEVGDLAGRLIEVMNIPFDVEGHHICIGTSIGIAETKDGAEGPDDLFKNADLALYQVKGEGGGAYRFFEAEMDRQIQAKRQLELDLRKAMAERQFSLFYQPLICAKTGAIVSFEALLRWNCPGRGIVSAADFIPLAEETGMITTLGLWVLNQACRDAMDWPANIKVAVNLSPAQFRSPDLVADVASVLVRSGLAASRLDLEITESLMLRDTEATLATLHGLRALGIRISMDDFGTGYSSLSYLRRFPFDKIKIDQSFIRHMSEGEDGLAIVRSVINLALALRMNVVAEGVETDVQVGLLRDAGCQEMQGYFFSPPQPASVAKALIERFARLDESRENPAARRRDRRTA